MTDRDEIEQLGVLGLVCVLVVVAVAVLLAFLMPPRAG